MDTHKDDTAAATAGGARVLASPVNQLISSLGSTGQGQQEKVSQQGSRGLSPHLDASRCLIVCVFAIAMAWVESAVVFDLRTMVDRIQPYQENPLPLVGRLGPVELVREFATMVMLFTVGVLAGRTWRARFGYMLLAFGIWDIFYYVFLKVMCGWPQSLLDWDILFLLPLPWWGPVVAPVLIALLMILWGTLATQFEPRPASRVSTAATWSLCFAGMLLALYVFMADCIRVADQGVEVIRTVLPARFDWPLFLPALALMAVPVLRVVVRLRTRPGVLASLPHPEAQTE